MFNVLYVIWITIYSIYLAFGGQQSGDGKVCIILKKKLKFRTYRPHPLQTLSPYNLMSKFAACNFWLAYDEGQFERILCSDKRAVRFTSDPPQENDVVWDPQRLNKVVPCNKYHGAKVTGWVAVVISQALPVRERE